MDDDLIEYALAVDLIECVAGINEDGYPARIPAKLSQSFAESMDSLLCAFRHAVRFLVWCEVVSCARKR